MHSNSIHTHTATAYIHTQQQHTYSNSIHVTLLIQQHQQQQQHTATAYIHTATAADQYRLSQHSLFVRTMDKLHGAGAAVSYAGRKPAYNRQSTASRY